MKAMKDVIIVFGVLLTIVSCEKVIDVPLNEADRRVIVEAVGRNYVGESYVILSKSGSVYDDSGFDKLSGATITITDGDGNVSIFTEDPEVPGRYISPDFATVPNMTYDVDILVDTFSLSAACQTMNMPVLDSINYILFNGSEFGGKTDTSYFIFYNFVDDASQTNFYRIRSFVNGELDNNYYLTNDRLNNGQQVTAPVFGTDAGPGDTVLIELISMDEGAYDYFFTLSSTLSSGAFGAAPANPVTNIEGGALGYAGMFLVDTINVILPE